MKKFMSMLLAGVAIVVLSGCGGGGDYYEEAIKFHLIDQNGFGVGDILYTCDGVHYDVTDGSGGFYFYPYDDCSLELEFPIVDSLIDDLFIIDDNGFAIQDIYYECTSGLFGYTDFYGYFEFDNIYATDTCTFEL